MIDSEVQRVAEDMAAAQGMLGAQQSQLQDLHAAADACAAAGDTLQDVSDATVALAPDFSAQAKPTCPAPALTRSLSWVSEGCAWRMQARLNRHARLAAHHSAEIRERADGAAVPALLAAEERVLGLRRHQAALAVIQEKVKTCRGDQPVHVHRCPPLCCSKSWLQSNRWAGGGSDG